MINNAFSQIAAFDLQKRQAQSRLVLCGALSLILHLIIALAIFFFFNLSLQVKKGTSLDKNAKIAGFQILGGDINIGENTLITPSQIAAPQQSQAKQSSATKKLDSSNEMPIANNTKQNFTNNQQDNKTGTDIDLHSLSLAHNNGKQQKNTQAKQSSSTTKALKKFPSVDKLTTNNIHTLYGEEFGNYGLAEQEFLVNNLKDIGRITQRYLEYPPAAIRLGQDGLSAVEFYLHPNGDISGLKLILSSEYLILDRNSTKTIQIAFKDYPRPSVTTKIRIYVSYGIRYY